MQNKIFDNKTKYTKSTRWQHTRDEVLYDFLMNHDTITRDDFNRISIANVDFKVNIINKGGVFKLTPYKNNKNGWYVSQLSTDTD